MKAQLRQLVQGSAGPAARNLVREYVQAAILGGLQRCGAMVPLAFHGGTALRFLYSLQRFSEDLDFALERPDRGYDFGSYLDSVRSGLRREGYDLELARVRADKTVHSVLLRFPGLLHELGLSGRREEAFAVRIEVDTRPPEGAGLETTIVRRHVVLNLQHHDRASLLAGKLHAVLQRPYPKGRDFYDLIWYLSDPAWPEPNLVLLNNALGQTGWTAPPLTAATWRSAVSDRLRTIRWETLARDVRPFLESADDRALLAKDPLQHLLRRSTPPATLRDKGSGRPR